MPQAAQITVVTLLRPGRRRLAARLLPVTVVMSCGAGTLTLSVAGPDSPSHGEWQPAAASLANRVAAGVPANR